MRATVDLKIHRTLWWWRRYRFGDVVAEDLSNIRFGNTEGATQALATLEATLRAEEWFFDKVREKLAEAAPLDSYLILPSAKGNDHLLNFAQFMYFLRALDCTSADQISQFIESHNQMIHERLDSIPGSKKPGELKKAVFGPARRKKIENSIHSLGRPVFAIYDYGHLLIDHMSPKTTENLIEDLRMAHLLVSAQDNSINADQRRILYISNGFLEETYERSLLVQRRMIAETFDADEFARVRGGN
jgi:hypothetical protein